MAATRPALTFSLLIATTICLMAIKAEEQPEVTEVENREAKQMYLMPQYYPANTQFYYPDRSGYENPYASLYDVPSAVPFVGGSQDAALAYGLPPLAFGDDDTADWRHVAAGGHDGYRTRWWHRSSNRQANIFMNPTAAQCLNAQIVSNGLGPCKAASQAEQGTIQIVFSAVGQTAIIGITADSQRHTRIRLICTETSAASIFTQSGQIDDQEATPRIEAGYMQLVITSTANNDEVKCFWNSYHHYTGMYP